MSQDTLCGLIVDYCDVFISCLDSHSDGTHSLQMIHWWASDVISPNVFLWRNKLVYILDGLRVSKCSVNYNYTPSASVRNLGVIFDDQLTLKEHIAKTARSCRFALHNIRKIRPFLTEHAAQLLVQALVISRLDYCNALQAGLPSNTIKPLQMIQNAAARLVFNEPKRAHVTPLFVSLHWLPVAARIQFKILIHWATTGSAPTYFHSLLRIYIPSRSLRSASRSRLVVPSQRGSKSLSRTFSFTVPGRWNDLPTPIRNAGSLSIFKQQLKTHLFQLYLTT